MVWLYMYNIDLYILLVLKGKQPLFLFLAHFYFTGSCKTFGCQTVLK